MALCGATVKLNAGKDKGDADKHQFQATVEKDKSVKIHFSFDSAGECADWIALVNQQIDESSAALFGVSVTDASYKTNRMVPTFLTYIVSLLRPAMAAEGIFRLPGSQNVINDLKARYSEGEEPDLANSDVPTLASLLKVYFRELATPIVPHSEVYKYFEAAGISDQAKFSAELKALVAKLDDPSRITLTYIIKFFKDVGALSAQNKMEPANLSIATAPSLLRVPAGKDELTAATQGLRVVERMISDYSQIFNPEDELKANIQPRGPPPPSSLGPPHADRPEVTSAERTIINAALVQHRENVDTCFYLRVLKCPPKTKTLEDALIVVGANRLYVVAHGKVEVEYSLLDLQEISSPSIVFVTLTFGNLVSKSTSELKFRPCSIAGYDLHLFMVKICNNWRELYVGAPSDLLKIALPNEERHTALQSALIAPSLEDGCGGFVKAYQAYCDYFNVPPLEDFIWDLENLFANNYIRDFILSECVRKDKYPNDEVKCFMLCLSHNTWFRSIVADNQRLGNEAALQVVNVFKTNRLLRQLKMSNVGASAIVFQTLAENILASPCTALNWINISLNSLDDKAVEKLGASFERLGSLLHLDVSGCGISKKAMPGLLDSLHKSTAICSTLEYLNISGNSMDSVDASRQLGLVLGKVKALRELNMANTATMFLNVLAAFEKSTLTSLNISDYKVTPKTQDDVTDFLKRSPALQTLIMTNLNVSPNQLNDILTTHPALKVIDISDSDFGDEGVISLCDHLFSRADVAPNLAELHMNRIFTKRTKDRAQAMNSLANLLEARPISGLKLRGGPKSQLKTDLVPLIFGLINNDKLVLLDVAGNQCGDGLPLAFAKILQHNHTLQTLYWDDNGTTMSGLRSFKIGLARNTSIRKMPLPVLDMANILKTETDLQAVVTLSMDIQEIVFDNALKSPSDTRIHLQQSISDPMLASSASSTPNASPGQGGMAKMGPKKPIEAPRGRFASAMPANSPPNPNAAPKKGLGPPQGGIAGAFKRTGTAPLTGSAGSAVAAAASHGTATAPSPSTSANGADEGNERSRAKSISKASVHRASLLFAGSSVPMEGDDGSIVPSSPQSESSESDGVKSKSSFRMSAKKV